MLTALDHVTYGNEEAEMELKQIRRLLTWVLYHHQGGNSPIGQAVRKLLGIGEFENLTDEQILDAKKAIIDDV